LSAGQNILILSLGAHPRRLSTDGIIRLRAREALPLGKHAAPKSLALRIVQDALLHAADITLLLPVDIADAGRGGDAGDGQGRVSASHEAFFRRAAGRVPEVETR
jgi:hypothetical protein